jgi:hypothetical protein
MVQFSVERYWLDSYVFDLEPHDTVSTLKLAICDITGQDTGINSSVFASGIFLTSHTRGIDSQCIQNLGETPPTVLEFEYDLEELDDNETLGSYSIIEGSILYLSDKNKDKIFLKALTGATFEFNVSLAYEPLLSLKHKLKKDQRIPLGIALFILSCSLTLC